MKWNSTSLNVWKAVSLKANEFSFVLKDSEGKTLETVSNDAAGNVKFSAMEFKKGQEGVHNYTVEEVKGTDATVTYDTMKANVTVTVKHDGTAKVLIATVGQSLIKSLTTVSLLQKNLSSNQRNMLFLKRNSISQVINLLMMTKSWQTSTQIQMRTHMRTMHQTTKRKLEH